MIETGVRRTFEHEGVFPITKDMLRIGVPPAITALGFVLAGYFKNPEATSETIKDGWLYTGDIARQDEEGFLYIVDRKKDIILTGGENVYSTEVENILYMHPAILETAVVGVPDDEWGERVAVCAVAEPALDLPTLREWGKQHLASYKVPSYIEFRDMLPKSKVGKLLRREIRDEERRRGETT